MDFPFPTRGNLRRGGVYLARCACVVKACRGVNCEGLRSRAAHRHRTSPSRFRALVDRHRSSSIVIEAPQRLRVRLILELARHCDRVRASLATSAPRFGFEQHLSRCAPRVSVLRSKHGLDGETALVPAEPRRIPGGFTSCAHAPGLPLIAPIAVSSLELRLRGPMCPMGQRCGRKAGVGKRLVGGKGVEQTHGLSIDGLLPLKRRKIAWGPPSRLPTHKVPSAF